ncbi:hypothetical protein DFJ63DRAFT_284307 [Scheffersomyces coipomensis]|uniref:uncharacterized protein n=1 Tax=Scheffersomyces coipomensis TaxID=1788519 RepID=UPI00315DC7B8
MLIDKETKYDRQLRLWASTGQSKLENSHICLINATATGCEIIKNLVLPGIGAFTIIDDKKVTISDLSGNFFLTDSDIGKDLATAAKENLNEMNYEVKGYDIIKSIDSILNSEEDDDVSLWDTFNVVIVSDYCCQLDKLKQLLWNKKIPLLIVNTIGFYGSLNLISHETTVIETHQSNKLYDLRIDKPWHELAQLVENTDLDSFNDIDHAHVPSIVIHIKALNAWKRDHDNKPPKTRDERLDFKKHYITTLSRNINLEGNFIEALDSFHRALRPTEIPYSLQELFNNNQIFDENLNLSTPIFWIYIKALKNFVDQNDGLLPLPGSLPDMESDTESFISLKSIYREKAIQDQTLFYEEVIKMLRSLGRYDDEISKDSITTFCKNAQSLHVSYGSDKLYDSSLLQELLSPSPDQTLVNVYFSILAFNTFITEFGKSPSATNIEDFTKIFKNSFGIKEDALSSSLKETIQELLAHSSRSYHNLSSLMGGIASQEVLKLTTAQYIPLDNVFVFDGIHSSSNKWKINS